MRKFHRATSSNNKHVLFVGIPKSSLSNAQELNIYAHLSSAIVYGIGTIYGVTLSESASIEDIIEAADHVSKLSGSFEVPKVYTVPQA